jgi:hypothetical protein
MGFKLIARLPVCKKKKSFFKKQILTMGFKLIARLPVCKKKKSFFMKQILIIAFRGWCLGPKVLSLGLRGVFF